jgi:23S rRNA (uracil1939-C5)-methyltransferase
MSEIEIVDFSPRGWGVGRLDDGKGKSKDVEVAHALPGDIISVNASKQKKKKYYKARLLEVIQASENRVVPRCAHTRTCGGCSWQELAYPKQLSYKTDIVRKAFHAHLGTYVDVKNTVPSPRLFHYRNKMEFSFSENKAGEKFLGLMIAGTRRYVFNVGLCHLMDGWTEKLLDTVRTWWSLSNLTAYCPHDNSGHLHTMIVRQTTYTNQKMVMLTVTADSPIDKKAFASAVRKSVGEDTSIFIREHHAKKGMTSFDTLEKLTGQDCMTEKMVINGRELFFRISPTSFFQPNTLQAEAFYAKAMQMLDLSKHRSIVFDLYSGTGTLAVIASHFAKKVIAIELNPESVSDAKRNVSINKVSNVEVLEGDVEKILPSVSIKPEVVIIDPPRAGLTSKAIDTIGELLPPKILYIACNPVTQAQNIAVLAAYGYKPKLVQPFDQFPHTAHVENIVYLVRGETA